MGKTSEDLKRAAALRAVEWIEDGMVVGLGTGSTVRHLLDAISARRSMGELRHIVGIPTSEDTRQRSEAHGIPLTDLTRHPRIDLTLDGADEFDPNLDLIKGMGGALLREKLVAVASDSFIVMVDESKRVARLGQKGPLPVEIEAFGLGVQLPFLRELGCEPRNRVNGNGEPFRTDGGNLIVDCWFGGGIEAPQRIAEALDRRSGVFEHGLFLMMTTRVVVGGAGGVDVIEREDQPGRPT